MKLEAIVLAAAMTLGSWPASAEYVRSTGDFDLACKSGAKSDLMQLSGPDDVFIKHHESGPAAVTVCVPDDSPGNAFVQWGGDHTWRNSGNLRNGCIEVPNARSVKIRAVATSFQQNATYYTCTP
jgi:hypothetical protein